MATFLYPAAIDPPDHEVPLAGARARLGFPSPADDFLDDGVDLHRLLVRNPAATYLYVSEGESMTGVGIRHGDILVVDRSVTPQHGDVVIAVWDGQQPTCKILQTRNGLIGLHSAHADHPPIILPADIDIEVFAVVGVVRQMRRGHVRTR